MSLKDKLLPNPDSIKMASVYPNNASVNWAEVMERFSEQASGLDIKYGMGSPSITTANEGRSGNVFEARSVAGENTITITPVPPDGTKINVSYPVQGGVSPKVKTKQGKCFSAAKRKAKNKAASVARRKSRK